MHRKTPTLMVALLLCLLSQHAPGSLIAGDSPDNPIFPTSVDPLTHAMAFDFQVGDAGLGVSTPIYLDPPMWDVFVELEFGPPFNEMTSIIIPVTNGNEDDTYLIRVYEAGDPFPSEEFEITIGLDVFFQQPAHRIEISEIPQERIEVDETGKSGFVFGLTFQQAGDISLTVTPHLIPNPGTFGLLAIGFGLLLTLHNQWGNQWGQING